MLVLPAGTLNGNHTTGVLDSPTEEALRSYQTKKGIPASGNLDPLTYYSLSNDDEAADKRLVNFGNYTFGWYDDYFSGSGAWDHMNSNEKSVRSSQLECFKDRNSCTETDALEATIFGMATITSTHSEFKITKWDHYELIAEDTTPDCERDELRINREEKTVSLISTPTYKSDSCKKLLGKPETVTYQLVDGTKIFLARQEANSKQKASLYQFSPSARAQDGYFQPDSEPVWALARRWRLQEFPSQLRAGRHYFPQLGRLVFYSTSRLLRLCSFPQ